MLEFFIYQGFKVASIFRQPTQWGEQILLLDVYRSKMESRRFTLWCKSVPQTSVETSRRRLNCHPNPNFVLLKSMSESEVARHVLSYYIPISYKIYKCFSPKNQPFINESWPCFSLSPSRIMGRSTISIFPIKASFATKHPIKVDRREVFIQCATSCVNW